MITHDPSEYVRGIQQLLVSDKKRIAFLCGAGTSVSQKNENSIVVPAVGKMTKLVVEKLNKNNLYKKAIVEISNEIGIEKFNIETFLTNVEEKKNVIGEGSLNGLNQSQFENLYSDTKKEIKKIVSVHENMLHDDVENLIHTDFAEWIGRAERKYPIEIFTTNYDYLFEIGLEEKTVPYYDGFLGSYKPFFCPESVDDLSFLPQTTKLWKIHGSLGWHLDNESKRVNRGHSDDRDLLIYPSAMKYANSKKQPYTALMDRLTNFLKQSDSVLFVLGYSFGDEHINERILTALRTNTTAHVYLLLYDKAETSDGSRLYNLTEESDLAKIAKENSKLSVLGFKNAVFGCQYGKWKLKREPDKEDTVISSLYFDEDAPENVDDKIGAVKKAEEIWTGEGEFTLPDFKNFVSFLKSMMNKF